MAASLVNTDWLNFTKKTVLSFRGGKMLEEVVEDEAGAVSPSSISTEWAVT
eukprot:CAMPEP_0172456540 /NCGR_PEP_ID=MMETSP1065-20121228/16362_1 /TAXON_ID=265537 /ORGANISM="Amphiprora paludosa, Strain CCMP125" /LENGTH=50 /DNA_ID=CAMNT_0013209635 /DNA_START=186 /DNA_END=335 /DNA_ORIENTATION=-